MLVSRPDITIPKPLIPTANTARSEASDKKQQAHSDGSNAIFGLSATIVILALILGLFSLLEALPVAHAADSKAVDTSLKSALGLDSPTDFGTPSDSARALLRTPEFTGLKKRYPHKELEDALSYLTDTHSGTKDPIVKHRVAKSLQAVVGSTYPDELPIQLGLPKAPADACDLMTTYLSIMRPGDPEGDAATQTVAGFLSDPRLEDLSCFAGASISFSAPQNRDSMVLLLDAVQSRGGNLTEVWVIGNSNLNFGTQTSPTDFGAVLSPMPLRGFAIYQSYADASLLSDVLPQLPQSITYLGLDYLQETYGPDQGAVIAKIAPTLRNLSFLELFSGNFGTSVSSALLNTSYVGSGTWNAISMTSDYVDEPFFTAAANMVQKSRGFDQIEFIDMISANNSAKGPIWMAPLVNAIVSKGGNGYIRLDGNYMGPDNFLKFYNSSVIHDAFIATPFDGVDGATVAKAMQTYNGTLHVSFSLGVPMDPYVDVVNDFLRRIKPNHGFGINSAFQTDSAANSFFSNLANITAGYLTLDGVGFGNFNISTARTLHQFTHFLSVNTRNMYSFQLENNTFPAGSESSIGSALAGSIANSIPNSWSLSNNTFTSLPSLISPLVSHPNTTIASLDISTNPFSNPITSIVQSGALGTDQIQLLRISAGSSADFVLGTFLSIFTSQPDPDGTLVELVDTQLITDDALQLATLFIPFTTFRPQFVDAPSDISAATWAGFFGARAEQQANLFRRVQGNFTLPEPLIKLGEALL